MLYYYGNGKRNTGDWCFQDGYITFRDIANLYLQCLRGRVLTIVTDCSHSGSWVKSCMEFLDEQGVQPCGHSATKNGIYLKVYASCKSYEKAANLCFAIRGVVNDKNTCSLGLNMMTSLQPTQHSCGYDFTKYRCKENDREEPCTFPSDYTWHKRSQSQRVYLVRGKDRGRPAWHYVLLVDDDKTIDRFHETVSAGNVDVADYGQVLKSGWGEDPPAHVKEWIEKTYG